MRSAEQSGAGANGFGAGTGKAAQLRKNRSRIGLRIPAISPVAAAIAITSVAAALAFILHDTIRTFDDARRDLAIAATAIVQSASERSPAVSGFIPSPRRTTEYVVTSSDQSWSGLVQRGSGALALAGLASLLAFSRFRGNTPETTQRTSYGVLAAAIPMGVACWTRTGDLVVCNDRYRDSLKLTGKTVTYHEAVRRLIVGGYMKLLKEDDNNRLLELHREDGSCLMIDERPMADGGFMTLVSDVTEAKRTDTLLHAIREEQRLLARRYHEEKIKAEAASRSKTNFLAHLSHDIRTPLNHIIGFAELMRHQTYGPLGDARYDDYVQSIKQSGEHLLASFATILDLAELESGQKSLRNDPVSIDDMLDGVVQRYRGQAARANVTFVLGESTGAVVVGDRLGLMRMVSNIVENSLRFTPSGGRVTLAAFSGRDGVVLEITDTGIGMDEERLASLSQPFALGDATFTREGIGPGLGISISRAIAELSGGHMAIDSSPSLGTTVAISLPMRFDATLVAAE